MNVEPRTKLKAKATGRIFTVVTKKPTDYYNPEGKKVVHLKSGSVETSIMEEALGVFFEVVVE